MKLQVFNYAKQAVRVAGTPESPLFVAADVCRVLDIENPTDTLKRLDGDEVVTIDLRNTLDSSEGIRGNPNARAVTESGLYALIFTSRKPQAKAFRKWVTAEVLPAIRRTGTYQVPGAAVAQPAVDGRAQVRSIVQSALQGLLDYTLPLARASRIFAGAKVFALLADAPSPAAGEDASCETDEAPEAEDWLRLISYMAQTPGARWTPGELRDLAAEKGLFRHFLTKADKDTQSVRSRFGKFCAARSGRTYGSWVFRSVGNPMLRSRSHYLISAKSRALSA